MIGQSVLGPGMDAFGAAHPSEFSKVVVEGEGIYIGCLDRLGQRTGLGTLVSEEEVYEGEWQADQKTGCGRSSLQSGRMLTGEFRQGLLEGFGQVQSTEKLIRGFFRSGQATGVCSVQYSAGQRRISAASECSAGSKAGLDTRRGMLRWRWR